MANDLTLIQVWAWASGSQLLSTCITLMVGSFVLYKWQRRHDYQYEVVRLIVEDIEAISNNAVKFWGAYLPDAADENTALLRQQIFAGFELLYGVVQECEVIKQKEKNMVHGAIGRLFDIITMDPFEGSDVAKRQEAGGRIGEILTYAAIAKQRVVLSV